MPVFWACGVTPQAAAVASRPELMITHAPAATIVRSQTSASGRTGEPVPPRSLSGRQTNANSRTPSRASASRFSDSRM